MPQVILMDQDPNEYYVIFEDWHLDPNQWSMLLDSFAVLLTLIGLLSALLLYQKQRKDNAKDAFDFFQSSLPELSRSIQATIDNLEKFNARLDADRFLHPMLSPTLNDRFLNKINLVHLNRFYKKYRKDSHARFRDFMVHSNFFGDYHSYFTQEIDSFGSHYLKNEGVFQQWQRFRSAPFLTPLTDAAENSDYTKFQSRWLENLFQDQSLFHLNEQGQPTELKNRQRLIERHLKVLALETRAFLPGSEKANEVNLIAEKVITAYDEMHEMKKQIRDVVTKDISKFRQVLENLNALMEENPMAVLG